jgi:hypothetical protein
MDDEQVPTATIADRVIEYLYAEEGKAKMIFTNPTGAKFGLMFDTKILVVLNKMCGVLFQRWHKARPEEGMYFREAGEASVSAFSELRNVVGIQFDGDIVYTVPKDTALKLSELIVKTIEQMETPDERSERLAHSHKAPGITIPRARIIKP